MSVTSIAANLTASYSAIIFGSDILFSFPDLMQLIFDHGAVMRHWSSNLYLLNISADTSEGLLLLRETIDSNITSDTTPCTASSFSMYGQG